MSESGSIDGGDEGHKSPETHGLHKYDEIAAKYEQRIAIQAAHISFPHRINEGAISRQARRSKFYDRHRFKGIYIDSATHEFTVDKPEELITSDENCVDFAGEILLHGILSPSVPDIVELSGGEQMMDPMVTLGLCSFNAAIRTISSEIRKHVSTKLERCIHHAYKESQFGMSSLKWLKAMTSLYHRNCVIGLGEIHRTCGFNLLELGDVCPSHLGVRHHPYYHSLNGAMSHLRNRALCNLTSHPSLPVFAGAFLEPFPTNSIKKRNVVIGIWKSGSYSHGIVGMLTLASESMASHVSVLTTSVVGAAGPSDSNDDNQIETVRKGVQRHVVDSTGPPYRLAQTQTNAQSSSYTNVADAEHARDNPIHWLSSADAGTIRSLEWNVPGDRLLAAFSKGWIVMWTIRKADRSRRVISMSTNQLIEGQTYTTAHSAQNSLGHPSYAFKAHVNHCRFSTFISGAGGKCLIASAGLGLGNAAQDSLAAIGYNEGTGKGTKFSIGNDESCLCLWEVESSVMGKDFIRLILFSNAIEKGSYVTHITVWAAKQLIIYGGKKGEIGAIDLRTHQSTSFVKPGIYRGILKIFVVEESRRLVVAYEDAHIRVWDLKHECATHGSSNGHNGLQFYHGQDANDFSLGSADKLSKHRQSETRSSSAFRQSRKSFRTSLSLIWQSPSPVHSLDTSKISLSSAIGAAINFSAAPAVLVDAHMISPFHLVTVGIDGNVILHRL